MGRQKKDLSYLTRIGIIQDFIKENTILSKKKVRRYLLALAKVYPYIISTYKSLDLFLETSSNNKSKLFNEFIRIEVENKSKTNPDRSYTKIKNTELHTVWMVQGFLGYIGKDYQANSKWIETFTPIPDFISHINMSDIQDLHAVLPYKGRTELEIQTLTGWNNIDLTQLRLDNFNRVREKDLGYNLDNKEYYYIAKTRQKTLKKKVAYLNVFSQSFYDKIERYCRINNIKSNELIFDIKPPSISAMYKYYLDKYSHINQKVIPQYIRQFCFTTLQEIFQDENDLLKIWSQHKIGILRTHYIKNILSRMIPYYQKIKELLEIGGAKVLKLEVKELRKTIKNELELQKERINVLEQKQKEIEEEKIDNLADKILKAIYKKKSSYI